MANNICELAQEALENGNFQLAVELYECILQISDKLCAINTVGDDKLFSKENYIAYGVSLARCGRIRESFEVFLFVCSQLGQTITVDKLKHVSIGLLESFSTTFCSNTIIDQQSMAHIRISSSSIDDIFLCPCCEDVLLCPITMTCGHTFCRDCIDDQSTCIVCNKPFLLYGKNFKQDVLISRLVEKWWTPNIQARYHNDEAQAQLQNDELDQALKSCNGSLEKCPTNFRGFLLRSEVLFRLKHFQSSLADADNAIKCRPNSYKAHLNRAMALSAMGLVDDAIISHCVSAYFNNTLTTYSNHILLELTKLIQKLLTSTVSKQTESTLNMKPYYAKEYIDRCRLRSIKHFSIAASTIVNDNDWKECIGDTKMNLNHHAPYRKNEKIFRNMRKARRKLNKSNTKETLFSLIDLDNLAKSLTNTSTETIVDEKRINDLFNRIQIDIYKYKKINNRYLSADISPSSIEASDFDCVLCYRTLWKPVTTPCGHTYCMVCLDRCLDYSSCCPLCKTSLVDELPKTNSIKQLHVDSLIGTNCNLVSFSSSKKFITHFVEAAMQRLIPSAFKNRKLLEIEKEPAVPVFICTTAYPSVPCPLYVYEPRHRLMIRRAIESGHRQFGIVQPHMSGGYSDYGTILDIKDCVLLGNGCSILSTIGVKRFKVIERYEKDGYDTAKIEYVCDESITRDRLSLVEQLNENIYKKANSWYKSLPSHIHNEIHKSFGSMPILQKNLESITDGPAWAWYIIALLPLNQNLKVEILATTDLEKRLRAIDKTLEYVAAQQRRSVCVVSCEGLQTCQAIDCCLRSTSSVNQDEPQPNASQSHVTEYLM